MESTRLTLPAPAKLNLFLHVTGRREDGYHDLQTLFQLLDYGDTLSFEAAPPGTLALHLAETSLFKDLPMDSNLVIRAARRLAAETGGDCPGASITLHKRIPPGAGLGGGSSDAATTLLALNELWRLNLSKSRLAAIGLQLGADVPLFIEGKSAWAEGVGERLQAVALEEAWYLVITPHCAVSTAAVFSHQNLTRNSPAIKMADFLAGKAGIDAGNDCESVTRTLYPEVAEALDRLRQFGEARMTGTGSGVFTRFPNEAAAREVLAEVLAQAPEGLTPEGFKGFVARGINARTDGLFER